MQYESWIDRQIREAQERGAFDNLPGAGKPLHLDDDPDWWIKAKIARENLEPLLPAPLALRREVEDLPRALADVRTEAEVREIVEDLNRRIRESYLRPHSGPRIVVGIVDVDATAERWRRDPSRRDELRPGSAREEPSGDQRPARARRKNSRFAGRSASRRMK